MAIVCSWSPPITFRTLIWVKECSKLLLGLPTCWRWSSYCAFFLIVMLSQSPWDPSMPKILPFREIEAPKWWLLWGEDCSGSAAAQSLLWMTFYTEVAKDHPNQRGFSPMASLDRFPKRFKMLYCDRWYFPPPLSLSCIILKSFTIYPWDNFIFILSYHIRTSKEGCSWCFLA